MSFSLRDILWRVNAPLFALLLFSGCAHNYVIPDSFEGELARSVSFESILSNPEEYKGRKIPIGGIILDARNLKEGTQIEVLQLPLDRYDRPVGPMSGSKGRFMVLHPGYLETAVLRNGHAITIVGELTGKKMGMIDEVEYSYPYLKAEFIHVWPEGKKYLRHHPYYPYRRWYPWAPYRYPAGPPVIIVPRSGGSSNRQFDPGR